MATRLNVEPLNHDPHAPAYWQEACQALCALHPVWQQLVQTYPDRALRTRGAPFETLLRSLVGQQISVVAADAVWRRVVQAMAGQCGVQAQDGIQAQALQALPDEALRAAGLSAAKVRYARALAEFEAGGQLRLELLDALDDEECMQHLCAVKGIGPWTAHMFLMFCLRRPDVWPVGDIGLVRGLERHFGGPLSAQEVQAMGEALRPWRSVATWYVWRSLDPIVVDY